MTLGTNIKFTLNFLSAKSLCWWKWILSYFKFHNVWIEDNLNTNGRGLSSDVDSAVLSVSHTSVTSTFQGQPLHSNSCWFAPQGHAPFPKLRLTHVRMSEFSQPKGTEALSGLSISIRKGSSTDTQCFVAVCLNIPLTVCSLVRI